MSLLFSNTKTLGLCTAAAVTLCGIGVSQAQADIITLPNSINQQGRINDSFSQPGTLSEGRTIRFGTTGGNAEFRGYMIFDTASFVGGVGTATLTYEISTTITGSAPGAFTVYGVSVDAGFDGVINSAGERQALFESAGGPNATVVSSGAFATGVNIVDVTSFVSTERGNTNNVVAFLFVEDAPTFDGAANLGQVIDSNDPGTNPQLELVVPEPSSLALLGLGALACVRRRRS